MRTKAFLLGLFGIFLLLSTNILFAKTKPKYEAGLGLFGFQLPHYYGSNHYYQLVVPYPRIIYRFDNLEISQASTLYLFDSDFFQVKAALSGNLPVYSDSESADAPHDVNNSNAVIRRVKNYTRRGMDDLPATVFLGLRSRFYFSDHVILEFPYFHGAKLESSLGHVGNNYEVSICVELFDRDSDHELNLTAANFYGDKKYNNFFYKVKEDEVLADRPAYDAEAGLVASIYGGSFYFQITDRFSISAGYWVNDMRQSIVKDSPLVVSKVSSNYFFMISYSFFLSDQTVNIP